jgi:hypothetical protein
MRNSIDFRTVGPKIVLKKVGNVASIAVGAASLAMNLAEGWKAAGHLRHAGELIKGQLEELTDSPDASDVRELQSKLNDSQNEALQNKIDARCCDFSIDILAAS